MPHLNMADLASRATMKKGWKSKDSFKPGGHKGKLHRELGIAEGEKIPKDRLAAATRSHDPEIRRDAIRARTMSKWKKPGSKKSRRETLYDHKD